MNKATRKKSALQILMTFFVSSILIGQIDNVLVSPMGSRLQLGSENTQIFFAQNENTSVDDILRLPENSWSTTPEGLRFGHAKNEIWLRFFVEQTNPNPFLVLSEVAGIERFDVWIVVEDTTGDRIATFQGTSGWLPGVDRTDIVENQSIAALTLRVSLSPVTTVLVRLPRPVGPLNPYFSILSSSGFTTANGERMLLQGTGIGFTVMMLFFALFVLVSVPSGRMATYAGMVFASLGLVTHASGFGPMILWKDFEILGYIMRNYIVLMYIVASVEFFRRFIVPDPRHPWFNTSMVGIEISVLVFVVLSVFLPPQTASQVSLWLQLILFIVVVGTLVLGVIFRFPGAKPLFFASFVVILGGIVNYGGNLFNSSMVERFDIGQFATLGLLLQHGILAGAIVRQAEIGRNTETTRRRDAETRAAELQEQAIEAERLSNIATLVSSVSHELSTPLGIGVTLGSELREQALTIENHYLKGTMTRSVLEDFLKVSIDSGEIIEENMSRARDLMDGFKMVAADQAILEVREISIGHYLEQLARSIRPRFRHTPHTLETETRNDAVLRTNPGYLSQVVINLVNNSLKHGFVQEKPGEVRIICEAPSENDSKFATKITVLDNGCGISPEHQSRVFEPFFTTAGNRGGTGLGLVIAKRLIEEKLGGTIKLESSPGKGTKIEVQIPDFALHREEHLT